MKAGRDQIGVWEEKVFVCQKFDNVVFQSAGKLCFFPGKEVDLSLS